MLDPLPADVLRWLAEHTGRNHGLLTNLVVGIIGAFLGGFLFSDILGFQHAEA
jgi:uncharacterized membrane protein YeaQ/YmgE (transglycosylase-associated protein family)